MAKIENLDVLDEILESQQKVQKLTPQNYAIIFNLCVMYVHSDWYFPKIAFKKSLIFFPITKIMIYT